jgi:hypothetical protein
MNYQEYKVSEWYDEDKLSETTFNKLLESGQRLVDSFIKTEDTHFNPSDYKGNHVDVSWVTGIRKAWKEDVQDFEDYKEKLNQFNLTSVYTTKQLLINLKNRFLQKLKNIFTL